MLHPLRIFVIESKASSFEFLISMHIIFSAYPLIQSLREFTIVDRPFINAPGAALMHFRSLSSRAFQTELEKYFED